MFTVWIGAMALFRVTESSHSLSRSIARLVSRLISKFHSRERDFDGKREDHRRSRTASFDARSHSSHSSLSSACFSSAYVRFYDHTVPSDENVHRPSATILSTGRTTYPHRPVNVYVSHKVTLREILHISLSSHRFHNHLYLFSALGLSLVTISFSTQRIYRRVSRDRLSRSYLQGI